MAATDTRGDVKAHYADRWARLQDAMAEEGLDSLIVASRGVIGAFGNVFYVAGYTPMLRPCYAVLHASGEPVLFLPNESDKRFALQRGVIQDVRNTGEMEVVRGQPAAAGVVDEVKSGGAALKVGIAGLGQIVPVADYQHFQSELANADLVDASGVLARVKQYKTDWDVAQLKQGFALAQRAYDAAPELLRPGARAQDAVAELERILRADTGTDTLVFVDSRPDWARRVTDTTFAAGDLVMVLVEVATEAGYFVEQGGLFSLGEPSPDATRVADACLEALRNIGELIAPGTPVNKLTAVQEQIAERERLELMLSLGHGVGVDHDLPTLYRTETAECEPGHVISVHPYYTDVQKGIFGGVADAFHVTETGAEQLSSLPHKLTVV